MYADIIIDIQAEQLDRIFEYEIPPQLEGRVAVGAQVTIPFGPGNRPRNGYVVGLSSERRYLKGEVKQILSVPEKGVDVEGGLVRLAGWMSQTYGATFLQALKTVVPVKAKIRHNIRRTYYCELKQEERLQYLEQYRRKKYKAKIRVMEAFLQADAIPDEMMERELGISAATLRSMTEQGILRTQERTVFRNAGLDRFRTEGGERERGADRLLPLNETQAGIVRQILEAYDAGGRIPCYIHGVTGSGKTMVYMALAEAMLERGRQVIVLIPEISLTAQTVMRFYKYFGDTVSFVNSRLSKGERYDQYVRAKEGELAIMIGPRSALFTPFHKLGMIIIDEEHDGAYKSEQSPRYHAVETALARAAMQDALVVMGSATPSMEAYYRCEQGGCRLFQMKERASGGALADVSVVDMREELKKKNRSIFSEALRQHMETALAQGEQIMLFLNRRGYAGFVSCRNCGHVFQCPHCEISLTSHRNGRLKCHYCGYQIPLPKRCPECGSEYIAAFGLGTEKVDSALHTLFPDARTLIMDRDTTARKNSMEEILSQFASHEADILIGTQMIVKGHDFADVTVMGILAADMTLNISDYRSGERTFQLITQAAGRAGRGQKKGNVIIQTYQPHNFVIEAAAAQDYERFYRQEKAYRSLLAYPPCGCMLEIICFSEEEKKAYESAAICDRIAREYIETPRAVLFPSKEAALAKVKDIYRRTVYVKSPERAALMRIKDEIIRTFETQAPKNVWLQFDFQ